MASGPMNDQEYSRLLTGWLHSEATVRAPDGLLEATLARTAEAATVRVPRLPVIVLPGRSFSRLAWTLLVLALVGAVGTALVVGSRARLPDPVGPAANGAVAFVDDGTIHLVSPDGIQATRIVLDGGRAATPVFSPDGTRLAYQRRAAGAGSDATSDLVLAAVDGSGPIVIDTGALGMSVPSWSPDGRWLAFSKIVDPATSLDQVFTVPSDGSRPPVAVGDPTTPNWFPRISPDGSRIAYFRGTNGLFVMGRDGRDVDGLTTVFFGKFDWLEWSPDGSRIAFSGAQWSDTDLWLVGLDGEQETPLTNNHNGQTRASWSPDGSRLAFLSASPSGKARLVVADRDGAGARVLAGEWSWVPPVWSPDGTLIAVATEPSGASEGAVHLIDPEGDVEPVVLPGSPDVISWQRLAP